MADLGSAICEDSLGGHGTVTALSLDVNMVSAECPVRRYGCVVRYDIGLNVVFCPRRITGFRVTAESLEPSLSLPR